MNSCFLCNHIAHSNCPRAICPYRFTGPIVSGVLIHPSDVCNSYNDGSERIVFAPLDIEESKMNENPDPIVHNSLRVERRAEARESQEVVNHPQHYGGDTLYEAIKVIEAWQLGFHLGNVVKYISRWDKKGDAIENLKKAQWYLQRKIEQLEKQQ